MIGMLLEQLFEQSRQFLYRTFIFGIADIDDLIPANIILVFQNLHKRRDAVVHIGKTALLPAAVHQIDRTLQKQLGDKLRHNARASLFGGIQRIEPRPDPVEGTEKREFQAASRSIGINHTIQKLFAAGINPALLANRPHRQIAFVFVKLRIGAGAVDFRRGGKDNALVVFDALLDNVDVHFKIQVIDADGVFHVSLGGGDRHQRHDDVTFFDMVFNPFPVDGNIPLQKIKAGIVQGGADPLRSQIHSEHLPVRLLGQNPVDQMMPDEPVDAQY